LLLKSQIETVECGRSRGISRVATLSLSTANFLETIVEEKSMVLIEVRKYFQLNAMKEYECLEIGYLERTNEDITKWVENILRF